jgi:hypothetical protein
MTIEKCPTCQQPLKRPDLDGRLVHWRVRVRLYLPTHMDEPAADSDPDLSPDRPGDTVVAGLPAVALHVQELAEGYHGGACEGLDEATLHHKLKGLRPTLSRRGGNAVWRLYYRYLTHEMFARVDIAKETAE